MSARRHGAWGIAAPAAPSVCVQGGGGVTRELHGQQVVDGVHAAAALVRGAGEIVCLQHGVEFLA